ncbi:MAG: Holliday junction resolvase RuvX [Proteobacteria bacterium]|nr:Holliday junction resolvase RuvX [Pseudomonadota bacterium]MBU1611088.1 Holliday junction resolvase RuvX [Pseudomonadota bacterium]
MKTLCIDYGLKRVGLALCDPEGRMAFPLETIERTTRQKLFDDLADIIHKESVQQVVIGLPLGLDGQETETTRMARNFAASLTRRVNDAIGVTLVDERLSSAEAQDRLREAGVKATKMKSKLDSQAAVIILETWLRSRDA